MDLDRKQAGRRYHFGLGQLAVGGITAFLFAYWTIQHFSTFGYLPGFGLIFSIWVLVGAGRSTVSVAHSRLSDLPDSLTRQQKYSVVDALKNVRSNQEKRTPGTKALERKTHIIFLCRMLLAIALIALMIVTKVIDQHRKDQARIEKYGTASGVIGTLDSDGNMVYRPFGASN